MRLIEDIGHWLNRMLLVLAGISMLLLMLVATANVVLRTQGRPLQGAYEVVGYLGALAAALVLGETQKRKDHIMVDVLTRRFPRSVNRILDGAKSVVFMAFFAIVSWRMAEKGLQLRRVGELSETLKAPFHAVIFGVSLGFAVLALALLVDCLIAVTGRTAAEPGK
jgi:TRAP-type C4-dicarboxylate transport system permease small subunit